MAGLVRAYVTPHAPRICNVEAAFSGKLFDEGVRDLRDALAHQGRGVQVAGLDALVINSCHLVSTFPTLIIGTPRHRGVFTAMEAPDQLRGIAYDLPGHYPLAAAIVDCGVAQQHQCFLVNDVLYQLDYGSVMPLLCYLDPAQRIPVIPVSSCLMNDLDECFAWGRYVAQMARQLGLRTGFIASGSLSHKIVRGPARWPSAEDQQRDHTFARTLEDGDYEKVWAGLTEYVRAAEVEMGGRHLAMMLGALIEAGGAFTSTLHGYGGVSGSGNYAITLAADGDPEAGNVS